MSQLRPKKICIYCRKKFKPKAFRQKWCSDICRESDAFGIPVSQGEVARLIITTTRAQKQAIIKIASEHGTSASSEVRLAIDRYLKDENYTSLPSTLTKRSGG